MIHTVKVFSVVNETEVDSLFNSLAFSMIQCMLAIWSLVPLPFLNPACTSGRSQFTYCWSLAWRILNITLLTCEMSATVQYLKHPLHSSAYSCQLILISSASVRSLLFCSLPWPSLREMFPWPLQFFWRDNRLSHLCFPLFLFVVHLKRLSYLSLLFSGTLHSVGFIFLFSLGFLFFSFLSYS